MAGYDEFTFDLPDAALTDFTLMLDLSLCSASWWAAVDTSDGTRGRAYKQDGTTRLAVDWINFDSVANTGFARILWSGTLPISGTIKLRIEPPQAANSSVAASDTYGSDNAYDANWAGYWPLDEASGTLFDRTANSHDGTAVNSPTYGTAGKIGKAITLDDASSQYIDCGLIDLSGLSGVTVMQWSHITINDSSAPSVSNWDSARASILFRTGTAASFMQGYVRASGGQVSANFTDLSPAALDESHWVMRYDSTDGLNVFANAVASSVSATANGTLHPDPGTNNFEIGGTPHNTTDHWTGVLDDIQLHTVARSDAWIKHEYDQTNAPSTFWGTPTWVPSGATYTLTAAEGSFTLTGVANGLAAARQLPAAVGAFTLSGPATGLAATRKLPATAGTLTLTGIDAGLAAARKLPTTAGEFTLTGITTGLAASRKLPAAVGAFTLAGIDAVLTYNGINSYTLVCSAGTFTFTGIDAALTAARKLAAATGTLTLTGIDAGFTATRRLPCDVRAYTLTGQAVTLDYSGAVAPSFTIGRLHTISRPPKVHTITRPLKVHTIQP